MSISKHKKQNASFHASLISSKETLTGQQVPSISVDGDRLLLHLDMLAQELHGQSTGVVERLCQEITDFCQGYVRLVLLSDSRLAQTHPDHQHPLIFLSVEYGGRSYGKLEVAPDPTCPDQPILPYLKMQVIASKCALILYSLEAAAYFQKEYPSPVNRPLKLTMREQEILKLLYRGYQRKQIGPLLHIQDGTVDKTYGTLKTQLGANTEREVIAAAFRLGLTSPIDNLSANVSLSPTKQET